MGFGGPFVWYNDKKPHITIASDRSVEIDTLSMIKEKAGYDPDHKFAQRIVTGFRIKGISINFASLKRPNFDLRKLAKFFPNLKSISKRNIIKGLSNNLIAGRNVGFQNLKIPPNLPFRMLP